tara:strand:+ start:2588 stop:2794 length:207 start_codon:yes stop_codon:yes gene_type:complete
MSLVFMELDYLHNKNNEEYEEDKVRYQAASVEGLLCNGVQMRTNDLEVSAKILSSGYETAVHCPHFVR